MLDQLMWKDLQNQKGILLLGVFFLLGPYGTYIYGNFEPEDLATSCVFSLVVSQLTIVVMGATIVGLERQNGSMDFLLGHPVSRFKILFSKALICLIVASVIWATFLIVLEGFVDPEMRTDLRAIGLGTAITGFLLFAVAWFSSIVIKGTAIPFAVSLIVAILILIAVFRFAAHQEWDADVYGRNLRGILYSLYLLVGATSFVAGWVVFVRRFEP